MAGTKETPRQRMIGMMYLVLTALLALNVSKDLLDAFLVINDGLTSTNMALENKSQSIMSSFESQMAIDAKKTRPYFEKAQTIAATSKEMNEYVDQLKRHLIKETEGHDETTPDSMYVLRTVMKKDDYDKPTELLVGSEPAFPKEGAFTALELKQKIETFRRDLTAQFDPVKDADFIAKLEADLQLNEVPNADGKKEPWEVGNFYHLPLAACITNLTKIQSDIRSAESDALKSLYDNVSKESFKFDTIAAKVIPRSSYVLLGEKYEADVFLAAFSSTEQPLMQTGIYKADSSFKATDSLMVSEGLGKMSVATDKEGFHTYQGLITMTRDDGTTKTFPFESEYLVARPSLTVAPTKMNVLYKGITNPIKVSAPGVANENLSVTITGGNQIKRTGDGQYEVNMSKSSPRDVHVVVTATIDDGSKREMGREPFRVKRLPRPYAKIGDVLTSGRMSNQELISKRGIRAIYDEDFDFALTCRVTSFSMSTRYQSNQIETASVSNEFTGEMKTVIAALRSGSKVTFEKIMAVGDDGVVHEMSPIVITIK